MINIILFVALVLTIGSIFQFVWEEVVETFFYVDKIIPVPIFYCSSFWLCSMLYVILYW